MALGYWADAFDLINVGDLDLIEQAAAACDRLVVGVYTDEYAEARLGRRVIVPLVERMALVRHMRGVSEVLVHGDDDTAPGGEHVRFVVAEHADAEPEIAGAVVLVARRQTQSAMLRAALQPGPSEAVA